MDLIERQAAIDALESKKDKNAKGDIGGFYNKIIQNAIDSLMQLPSVHPELFTDKEQRIFLAAMDREEEVCKEVDRRYVREPYEDSLMQVCKEIRRKVKGALWT